MIKVHPIAHLLGEGGPLFGIFHHLAAASGIILVHRDFLTDILFGDAEFLLHTELYGQAVGIPTGFAAHLKTLHRLIATERILNRASQNVVDAGHTVG